jgi:alpha-L-fucosidase
MDHYITFMKNQLTELVEEYNSFLIWFDGEWEWAWTHEMGTDMYKFLRGLDDKLLINNRVDKGRDGMGDISRSAVFAGDFATPEQEVGAFDNTFAWETCMTIGKQWAWKPDDDLKSTEECIHTLLQTIGGDGNLLFNVGPMPDGRIEQRQVDRLAEMGRWLSVNQEAVYGTRGGPYLPGAKMVSTHKGNNIYLHLLGKPGQKLVLPMKKDITVNKVSFLQDGTPLNFTRNEDSITIKLPGKLPDEVATVIKLGLDSPASEIPTIKL